MTMLQFTKHYQVVSDPKINTGTEHPPFSHDLTPNGFLLFPKIKSALKG
jgi:hypothetical protein